LLHTHWTLLQQLLPTAAAAGWRLAAGARQQLQPLVTAPQAPLLAAV
jgi:hypothetical protein